MRYWSYLLSSVMLMVVAGCGKPDSGYEISIIPASVTVPPTGGIIEVEVKSNVDFEVVQSDNSWLHRVVTNDTAPYTLVYSVDANETSEARTATIAVMNRGIGAKDDVEVCQPGLTVIAYRTYNNQALDINRRICDSDIVAHTYENGMGILKVSSSVTLIRDSAFFGCAGLADIDLPDGIATIGDSAFEGCAGLADIDLPDGITTIGDFAFKGCTGLTDIDLPDGITTIGDSAFEGCTGLTDIDLPDGITMIGDSAFKGCTGLADIDLPDGITMIGDSAFKGCTGLTDIDLPDGIVWIGKGAFSGCTGLTAIDLPEDLVLIDIFAFYNCTGLTAIDLPDRLITIGRLAFAGCGLKSIVIPDRVNMIGPNAFAIESLTEFYCRPVEPPRLLEVIFGYSGNVPEIYVPSGSVEAYKEASDFWMIYSRNIIGYDF